MPSTHGESTLARFSNDYGMLFVLLLLCVGISLATIREEYPKGADAGRDVAKAIAARHGANTRVLIVAGDQETDQEFVVAVTEGLRNEGATTLATVEGSARDARLAIEDVLASGESIDAIAATDVTARWSVFDKFPDVGSDRITSPASYHWPIFLTTSNLRNIANTTAVYAIIAIGMTMVIITAGIDLCVGSLVALGSVTTAIVIRDVGGGAEASVTVVVLAMVAGMGICALAGLFNGFMITAFGIPSFIVTLAMMKSASGLAFRIVDGKSVSALPESIRWLGFDHTLGVPNSVWLMFVLYAIAHFVMARTVFGRYVYAIGGNEEAARLSGVPVKRIKMAVYTICGALAGLGGIMLTSKLGAGDPKFGVGYELDVIAAVVVGGTSLMGGRGKILGTLIGAFIIAVIQNGMNLAEIGTFDQWIVLGAVLLAAVLIDTLKRKAGSR
ncbi:MAG: hypothetical protein MI757_10955 [Pirellulales bacterium]|nr:hypothetical protein [Pirellulales bacterium]